MNLWFTEKHSESVLFSIKINSQIYCEQSRYQKIDIYETPEFGRILVLDGYLMLTERDEFIYHEMITHVALAANPAVKRVLVIGAGDGGTVRELTRYSSVEHIDLVEIDQAVTEACIKYLPQTASALSDSRVNMVFADGLRYVRTKNDEYDLIIVDSTDPFGPGEGLFTKEFFGNCYKALNSDGILVNQHESVYYDEYAQAMKRTHRRICDIFPVCTVYQAHIPTYPSGHWLFGFASKGIHPTENPVIDQWNTLGITTRYYNTDLHRGAFAIPNYVKEQLEK